MTEVSFTNWRIFLFLLALLPLCLASTPANAQEDVLPPLSVTRDMDQRIPFQYKEDPQSGPLMELENLNNPYFRDQLELQREIILLERLVQWQSDVNRLKAVYDEVGLEFNPPAPPRDLCAKVVQNAICAKHYPGLYGLDVPDPEPAPKAPKPAISVSSQPAPQPVSPPPSDEPPDMESPYKWASVTCAAGTCKALLTRPGTSDFRLSIREGQVLPDSSVVADINPSGVRVRKQGSLIELDFTRAPSRIASSTFGRGEQQRDSTSGSSRPNPGDAGNGQSSGESSQTQQPAPASAAPEPSSGQARDSGSQGIVNLFSQSVPEYDPEGDSAEIPVIPDEELANE